MRHPKINKTKEGDLRVWNIINPPREPDYYPVKDINHAEKLIDCLAESQLLQNEIDSNVFGLEIYQDGEWTDWYDDDGFDLDEHFANIREDKKLNNIFHNNDILPDNDGV
jgi:hypothetical protein